MSVLLLSKVFTALTQEVKPSNMDTARWVVVLSVIFCMISVLTLLNRNANANIASLSKTNIESPDATISDNPTSSEISFSPNTKKDYSNIPIKFTPPPKQIFEMDGAKDLEEERKAFKTEGKIE